MRRVLLFLCAICLPVASAQAVSYDVYRVCRLDPQGDNFLALRSGPSSRSAMIAKLGPGTEIFEDSLTDRRGKWVPVITSDWQLEGWVFADYICLTEEH
jgi:hypothetical protein